MFQPARGDGTSSCGGGFQAGRQRSGARAGVPRTAPVLAVAVVARGADDDMVMECLGGP